MSWHSQQLTIIFLSQTLIYDCKASSQRAEELSMRGALGYIRNRKTEEKNHSKKPAKPQKNSAKTENRIQNRQKPIQC